MKKLLLILMPLFLCGNLNAKKPEAFKPARAVWFLMEQQENKKKHPNDSVIVKYRLANEQIYDGMGYVFYLPHVIITIQNNTERTIYVDLQKSCIIACGEIYPLFTNITNVSTQSNTSMAGANLGLIGVGSASTNVNTTVKQEQRIIIVPSDSRKELNYPFIKKWGTSWKLNDGYGEIYIMTNTTNGTPLIRQNFVSEGQLLTYSNSDTPFNLDFRVSYSFSEDLKDASVDREAYFTTNVIGSGYKGKFWKDENLDKDYQKAKEIFPQLDEFINNPDVLIVHMWNTPFYQ